jgi:FixJ family two-component response regulator
MPIILCTGHSDTITPEIAKNAGISAFFMKPLTRKELANSIRTVLDAKKIKIKEDNIKEDVQDSGFLIPG